MEMFFYRYKSLWVARLSENVNKDHKDGYPALLVVQGD